MNTELEDLKNQFEERIIELEMLKFKRDEVIIASFQLFEIKLDKFNKLTNVHPIWKREQIFDLQESLALIIEWVYRYSDPECMQTTSSYKIFSIIEEAFGISSEYLNLEASYKAVSQGMMKTSHRESCVNTINIDFISRDVAYFEAVNELILTNNNNEKFSKMPEIKIRQMLSLGTYASTTVKSRMLKRLEVEFELPDDYIIGPYSIKQIKEIWANVMIKAFIQLMQNAKNYKTTPRLMQLLEMDKFIYKYSTLQEVNGLLSDLTYIGNYKKINRKEKQIYSNFLTEPIVEINNKKLISPSIILNFQVSRNILSTLNRIYGDNSHEQKGEQFTKDLIKKAEEFPNLLYAKEVLIKKPTQTDVDFALFDKNTETLLIFEIKWFNEPVTPVEIKSKDDEIEKATTKQLPNYFKGILHNKTEFIYNAFGVKLRNPQNLNIYGFVLTKCTVGSGKINRNHFEVINQKMLVKGLIDSKGDLLELNRLLCNRAYFPKENRDFIFAENHVKVGDYVFIRDGYTIL